MKKTCIPSLARHTCWALTALLAAPTWALAGQGADIVASSPAVFTTRVQSEIVKWRKVIQDAGIKPE